MVGNSTIDGTAADRLCDMQGALVALTFVGMVLCASPLIRIVLALTHLDQAVLVVNLLRVFKKVARKR